MQFHLDVVSDIPVRQGAYSTNLVKFLMDR